MSFVYSVLNLYTSARSEDIKGDAKQLLWKVSFLANHLVENGVRQVSWKNSIFCDCLFSEYVFLLDFIRFVQYRSKVSYHLLSLISRDKIIVLRKESLIS